MGCDRRDCARKMGYAMRGERPVCSRVLSRGRRVSALAAMCSEGIIATELYEGTCDGDRFLNFIIGILIPVMLQFDGSSPRSVLIMDNCTVHHVAPVLQTLIDAGIIPMFLPPYSPDLNLAEELFSYIKYYLKAHDDLLQVVNDPKPIIKAAFDSVTVQDSCGWIHHSGYF